MTKLLSPHLIFARKIFANFLLVFLVLNCAQASTFSKCSRLLQDNPELLPYSISKNKLYSDSELELLLRLYNKYSADPNIRSIPSREGGTIRLTNPIWLNLEVELTPVYFATEVSYIKKYSKNDINELLPLIQKLIESTLAQAKTNEFLSNRISNAKKLKINFYTIRYLIPPDTVIPGLSLHRDEALLQSIAVLQRPANLLGGNLYLGWPKSAEFNNQFISDDSVELIWRPTTTENQLIVLDGLHAVHGVDSMSLNSRTNETQYRDVIGILINPL